MNDLWCQEIYVCLPQCFSAGGGARWRAMELTVTALHSTGGVGGKVWSSK